MCILYSVVVTLESRCGSLAGFDSGLALVIAKEWAVFLEMHKDLLFSGMQVCAESCHWL